ncbi:CgeB family protein [Lichenicoccus sp.]|uniref:CgeB family protein n=1 Tax=Lichenicoccus sp. TaxID=2781899 RepID=UPI003D0F8222
MKALICSGGRHESDANAQVRRCIMDGWIECLGHDNVMSANISGAAAVIAATGPDLVIGIGSYLPESTYFGEVTREAHRLGKTTLFWATEDPYEQDANYRILHDFDAIFSCDRWGVNFYTHPNAFHLPLAGCHKRHYVPIDAERRKQIDVLFCGVAFTSRLEIVDDLRATLAGLNLCFIGPGWGKLGHGFSDRRIGNEQLIDLYGQTRIVLNLGRSLHFENRRYMITPSSPGPRTFEAALAGTVQFFHEDTYEIRRYFTADEVPGFSNQTEFGQLLSTYLGDDERGLCTAELAQRRALSEHTYAHRAYHVVEMLKASGLA